MGVFFPRIRKTAYHTLAVWEASLKGSNVKCLVTSLPCYGGRLRRFGGRDLKEEEKPLGTFGLLTLGL